MKVFITGVTGYIGFAAAKTFRNAGHKVFGLTRNKEKAAMLERNEVVPVIGSMQNPSGYSSSAIECDVLIHAAADYKNDTAQLDRITIETLIKLSKESQNSKKLIYTSGAWVHGDTNGKYVKEDYEVNPIKPVEWRPEIEKLIIEDPAVNGIVIRPGCVYGKQGDMTNDWFEAANNQKEINIIGDGSNHWPLVHVEDLANAFLLAAEAEVQNEIFNIVEEESPSINEIISELKSLTKFTSRINYIPKSKAIMEMDYIAEALVIDQKFDTTKPKMF